MKYPSLIFFLAILFAHTAYSQDLIITNRLDTVPCTIVKKTSKYFNIQFEKNGKQIDTTLRAWQVKEFQRDYLAPPKPNKTFLNYSFKGKTIITPEVGIGYLTSKPEGNAKKANSFQIGELQVGWVKGVSIKHFLHNSLALGLTFNQFTTKNPRNHFLRIDLGNNEYYDLSIRDEIKRTFIGITAQFRTVSKDSLRSCSFNIDLGHISEVNNFTFEEQGVYTYRAIGANVGITFSQYVTSRIGLSAKAYTSFLFTQSPPQFDESQASIDKQEYGGYMHYNHLGFSFGVNIVLNKPKADQ